MTENLTGKTYAVINIGTLKVKSLIARFDEDNKIVPLFQSNNLTCFGCGMFEHENQILEKNLAATIEEVQRLKEQVKKLNCQTITLFATHALRDAQNKDWVVKEIKEKTGLDIEIIGPKEEGELYFLAAASDLPERQNFIVADIGGGSCQVLIGERGKLAKDYSFKTGAQFLHEKFTVDPHNSQSITKKDDIGRMKEYLLAQYSALPKNIEAPIIYGSSNIIDLMKALQIPLESYPDSANHPYKTKLAYLSGFVDKIIDFPYGKREEMYKFQEGYMWGIDKAFLNIITLAEKFHSPYILPSNANVVQGFLYKLREKEQNTA